MTIDFEDRLRGITRIRKLMAIAAGNSNQHESETAMVMARALAKKFMVDIRTLQPLAEDDEAEKRRKGREMFAKFGGPIAKAFPDADDEDYTKNRKE